MAVVAAAAVGEWVWLPGLLWALPPPPPPLLVLAPAHFQAAVALLVHHLSQHLPRERERVHVKSMTL